MRAHESSGGPDSPQVNDKSLVVTSWDALKELRDRTGETTQLLAMSEGKALILEQCVSDQAIKVSGTVGMRVPCYSCAPGKSILANIPQEEIDQYLGMVTLKSFTPRTLATRELLLGDLEKVGPKDMPSTRRRAWKEFTALRPSFSMIIVIRLPRSPQSLLRFACHPIVSRISGKFAWIPQRLFKRNFSSNPFSLGYETFKIIPHEKQNPHRLGDRGHFLSVRLRGG